jgi:hypothetical protein
MHGAIWPRQLIKSPNSREIPQWLARAMTVHTPSSGSFFDWREISMPIFRAN